MGLQEEGRRMSKGRGGKEGGQNADQREAEHRAQCLGSVRLSS